MNPGILESAIDSNITWEERCNQNCGILFLMTNDLLTEFMISEDHSKKKLINMFNQQSRRIINSCQ